MGLHRDAARRTTARAPQQCPTHTLAPMRSDENPRSGEVLRFKSESLPIFPDDTDAGPSQAPQAYMVASASHGSHVKLYDYLPKLPRSRGAVIGLDSISLLRRLELCLMHLALPVRLYDCRQMRRTREPTSRKDHCCFTGSAAASDATMLLLWKLVSLIRPRSGSMATTKSRSPYSCLA